MIAAIRPAVEQALPIRLASAEIRVSLLTTRMEPRMDLDKQGQPLPDGEAYEKQTAYFVYCISLLSKTGYDDGSSEGVGLR